MTEIVDVYESARLAIVRSTIKGISREKAVELLDLLSKKGTLKQVIKRLKQFDTNILPPKFRLVFFGIKPLDEYEVIAIKQVLTELINSDSLP